MSAPDVVKSLGGAGGGREEEVGGVGEGERGEVEGGETLERE